jgi:hypothetical protein
MEFVFAEFLLLLAADGRQCGDAAPVSKVV